MIFLLDQGLPRSTVAYLQSRAIEASPSVVRIRIQGLKGEDVARIIQHICDAAEAELSFKIGNGILFDTSIILAWERRASSL